MVEGSLPELAPGVLDGFEVWDRNVQAPAGQATKKAAFVSIRVGGVIGMNRAAREMLGPCDAIKVMYDPGRRRLGFVAADPEAENSYELRSWSNTQISCKKLFDYYGVAATERRRCYDLEVVDGILVANL